MHCNRRASPQASRSLGRAVPEGPCAAAATLHMPSACNRRVPICPPLLPPGAKAHHVPHLLSFRPSAPAPP